MMWQKDFEDFTNFAPTEASVPEALTQNIFSKVHHLLFPSAQTIFTKIFAAHLLIGSLSLSICHQFGLNPFHTEVSLADWFMRMGGHNFCMIACGILFLSLSLLASGILLTTEEIRVLRRTQWLQVSALAIVSLGSFAAIGAELTLGIAGFWLLGSLVGGLFVTEGMWRLTRQA